MSHETIYRSLFIQARGVLKQQLLGTCDRSATYAGRSILVSIKTRAVESQMRSRLGTPERFQCGKQIGSYVGLIPAEDSSAGRQRLGHISKQGSTLLRFLLVEAAQAAVRSDPDWKRRYIHLAMRRQKSIAKVAMGRKLAVRLYWMWRREWDDQQFRQFGSYAGELGTGHGVN